MGDKKKIVLADAAEEFRQMLADMIGGEADLTVCPDGQRRGAAGSDCPPPA